MDFKKILLILGLVVVGYLIILKWSQEYEPQHHIQEEQRQHHQVEFDHSKSGNIKGLNTTNSSMDDIPVVKNQSSLSTSEKTKSVISSLISVSTDSLMIKIDPNGGNIVKLSLPKYSKTINDKNPFVLLDDSSQLEFIAQSGLVSSSNKNQNQLFTSPQTSYTMSKDQQQLVVDLHQIHEDKIKITKRYIFERNSYVIQVKFFINNLSSQTWTGNFYAQLKRDNSKDPGLNGKQGSSVASYLGAAIKTDDSRFKKVKFGDFTSTSDEITTGGYAAIIQHYFVTAWVPIQDKMYTYTARKVNNNNIVGFYGSSLSISPGEEKQVSAQLYAGPKVGKVLGKLAHGMELTIDYGWLWFIASPMFAVLAFLYSIFGNWGWSVILLTALIKLVFYPLSSASYKSMAKMRALQPKMKKVKERHGGDKQKMSQELMALYKKEKVNPMGGCLPILVQMPFFIALYEVLIEAVQLRQAPWVLWIHDLSIMDPYLILPLLMGGSMLIQQRLSPAPPDPTQAKIMRLMPIMFTIFFIWFPAGLVLYWVTNNFLSILQQWWITKKCDQQLSAQKTK